MSSWIEDTNGYVSDLASTGGLEELHALPPNEFPALLNFLDKGEADESAVLKIIEETSQKPITDYIARALSGSEGTVIITDGLNGPEHEQIKS